MCIRVMRALEQLGITLVIGLYPHALPTTGYMATDDVPAIYLWDGV